MFFKKYKKRIVELEDQVARLHAKCEAFEKHLKVKVVYETGRGLSISGEESRQWYKGHAVDAKDISHF